MNNDVEGSFIPLKLYDFVLPPDFKIEETPMFTTKLQPKKADTAKVSEPKSLKKTEKSQKTLSSQEKDIFPEEEIPKPTILKKAESLKTNIKPRPYSAPKKPVEESRGKTLQELDAENKQKQGAKEFVANWLEQADHKRQDEVEEVEKTTKFRRYDNKISEEISELIKKIENTRKHTFSSIKNMKKTLSSATSLDKSPKLSLTSNPFKTFITPSIRPSKAIEKSSPVLDLHALYSTEHFEVHKSTQDVVSDDEDFVKNIEFDD